MLWLASWSLCKASVTSCGGIRNKKESKNPDCTEMIMSIFESAGAVVYKSHEYSTLAGSESVG